LGYTAHPVRSFFADPEIVARVERLELPFNQYGVDPYGVSKNGLVCVFSMAK